MGPHWGIYFEIPRTYFEILRVHSKCESCKEGSGWWVCHFGSSWREHPEGFIQWFVKMPAEVVLLPLLRPTGRWQCQDQCSPGKAVSSVATDKASNGAALPIATHLIFYWKKFRAHLSVLRQPKPTPSSREVAQQPELPSRLFPCFACCQEARRYFPTLQPFIFCSFYSD